MASVTTSQLSNDMYLALADFSETLTVVLPSGNAGTTFDSTRRELQDAFTVDEHGRETMLDTRFYLNINGVSTYPSKGWILSDGTRQYKVLSQYIDSGKVALTLDCESRYNQGGT